ncbi:MAG: elongation factor 4, partial [Deltaproteobacteria bacterium]|nr:elongation factor 4 [Deltaproteobacteria bacterium]
SGVEYLMNLIDTPGHVDFTYEVSRSLAACEGAILVVDAAQGVEAQTVANVYLALDHDLTILPVINKIDLPSANPDRVKKELEDVIGIDASEAILASAKEGIGTEEILEGIANGFPPAKGDPRAPLRALIFDSWFDPYHGSVVLIRIVDGKVKKGSRIRLMSSGKVFEVTRLGIFSPGPMEVGELGAGEVGFLMAAIKEIQDTRIGDTITTEEKPSQHPLPGFKPMKPMVFSGIYPTDSGQYQALRAALEKLSLNDSSFTFEGETSQALGFGFRCGFLGLLHLDIVRERLEREFNLDLITTAPTVVYEVVMRNGKSIMIDNPVKLPAELEIDRIEEPCILTTIHVPNEYLGNIMKLCEEKRGVQKEIRYLGPKRV